MQSIIQNVWENTKTLVITWLINYKQLFFNFGYYGIGYFGIGYYDSGYYVLALLATRDMAVSLLLRAAPRVEGVFPERILLVRILRVRLHFAIAKILQCLLIGKQLITERKWWAADWGGRGIDLAWIQLVSAFQLQWFTSYWWPREHFCSILDSMC